MKIRYPLLKLLLLLQIVLAFVGVAIFTISFNALENYKTVQRTQQRLEAVRFALQGKVGLWTSWVILGMPDALQNDMGDVAQKMGLEELKVVELSGSNAISHIPGELTLPLDIQGERKAVRARIGPDDSNHPSSIFHAELNEFPIIAGLILMLSLVFLTGGFIFFYIYRPLQRLSDIIRQRHKIDGTTLARVQAKGEIKEFAEALRESWSENVALERERAAWNTAKQVAHDIRSPLAALEVAAGDVSHLPEDKRILIRSAVGRIRDIANSLLDRQRASAEETKVADGDHATPSAQEALSPQLLSSLIESLATEKRLQFRSRSRVEIEAWLDAASYGIFAQVQPVEFKRLLSNLINNSVEAFGLGPGTVRVNLSARDGRALVSVQDDGKGIPPEILARIGQRGETHGKSGGSGLGLYHARTSAESWGGRLQIASETGKGTMITADLPQAPTPEWFVSELALVPGRALLILDDDESIHQVWQGRLDALRARERDVEVVHVSTPGEIRNWVKDNVEKAREALYLVDYELLGYRETGLSLAEELGIGECAVLVTSRYEEPGILEDCRKLKTRMIPKGLAGLVPIRIENPAPAAEPARELWDAVLIDDDPLARMTWTMAAERAGKKLRAFSTAADFLKESDAIDRNTPMYVDAELGNGVKGDVESARIHELGFGEIYLATGHAPEKFAGLTHLRGVIGKAPPWKA